MTKDTNGDKRVRAVHKYIPSDWDKGPLSLAQELRQLLQSVVDEGTSIDSGGVTDLPSCARSSMAWNIGSQLRR